MDYDCYTFLNNLTDNLYDVQVKEPGRYHFRVFTGDDTCIGRSASIEVTP